MNDFFANVVTENKEIPEAAKSDLAIAMITLKYTQSNSVCYVKGGQAIGIGAGQQSRIHCTRLAGTEGGQLVAAPEHRRCFGLQFKPGIRRADRDNAIDLYIGEEYMDVLADGAWQNTFAEKPPVFTRRGEAGSGWTRCTEVALGSDAFFPFGDNIERAHRERRCDMWHSRAAPSATINVIETCNKYRHGDGIYGHPPVPSLGRAKEG